MFRRLIEEAESSLQHYWQSRNRNPDSWESIWWRWRTGKLGYFRRGKRGRGKQRSIFLIADTISAAIAKHNQTAQKFCSVCCRSGCFPLQTNFLSFEFVIVVLYCHSQKLNTASVNVVKNCFKSHMTFKWMKTERNTTDQNFCERNSCGLVSCK